jgi:hypothetical protein
MFYFVGKIICRFGIGHDSLSQSLQDICDGAMVLHVNLNLIED